MSTNPDETCSLDSFDSQNVNLIVEGVRYKIHRLFLWRDSPVLREKFSEPVDVDVNVVYPLDSVTKEEFEHLLWMYYNPRVEDYFAPIATWRDILKLADMWKMAQIKDNALRHLLRAELDPIEKIQLCERNGLDRSFASSREEYMTVCTRKESLTPVEFQALSMEPCFLSCRSGSEFSRIVRFVKALERAGAKRIWWTTRLACCPRPCSQQLTPRIVDA
ncbi:hypothetical protein DFH06DRAFT_1102892 [Mycena polygramma]|nr:hypothetical protein DFH06DRAFT_1102892 [Mycena polygramma]